MKNQKGITFISLVIVVTIVIFIIAGIVLVAKNKVKNVGLVDLKTDMLLVQGKMKLISDKVLIKEEGAELIGTNMSENPEDECVKQILEMNIVSIEDEDYNGYYIIKQEDLEKMELKEITLQKDNIVVVNYATGEVIYTKGYKANDGKMYYKLSDIKNIK